jgi:hypothetical protein
MNLLAHYINEKDYLSIINNLYKHPEVSLSVVDLHDQIFDYCHVNKPLNILLPIHDYTQEFHDFISKNFRNINILIYFGPASNKQLFDYYVANDIKTIGNGADCKHTITYEKLYDDTIFRNENKNRNDKFLCILSDNDINKKFLDNKLYPDSRIPVCLINNQEFKHVQNIGIAYNSDLNELLNTYMALIDLTNSFTLEAEACGIQNLMYNESDDLLTTIEKYMPTSPHENFDIFKASYFVSNSLIPNLRS